MILKGGVDIRHAGMPGIACIREKAQIRQFESFDHRAFFFKRRLIGLLFQGSMDKHDTEQYHTC